MKPQIKDRIVTALRRAVLVILISTNLMVMLWTLAQSLYLDQYGALVTFGVLSVVLWSVLMGGDALVRRRLRRRNAWRHTQATQH